MGDGVCMCMGARPAPAPTPPLDGWTTIEEYENMAGGRPLVASRLSCGLDRGLPEIARWEAGTWE